MIYFLNRHDFFFHTSIKKQIESHQFTGNIPNGLSYYYFIIIIKKGRQWKAERESDIHPISTKTQPHNINLLTERRERKKE